MTDTDPRKVIVANSNQRSNKLHFTKQHASTLHYFGQGAVFLLSLISDKKKYKVFFCEGKVIMEKALEKSWNNYHITSEGKVLLLKDIDLKIYTVGKYVKKYKVYKVLLF